MADLREQRKGILGQGAWNREVVAPGHGRTPAEVRGLTAQLRGERKQFGEGPLIFMLDFRSSACRAHGTESQRKQSYFCAILRPN